MTRARDVSRLITTPPNIYATDSEASAGYLPLSSPVTSYKIKLLMVNLIFGKEELPLVLVAILQIDGFYR
jgi:hypothetical protein